MKTWIGLVAAAWLTGCATTTPQEKVVVQMNSISEAGVGESVGSVTLSSVGGGLLITPDLRGLTPGDHGFHVHENPSCAAAEKDGAKVAGLVAGGHYDPHGSKAHSGPQGTGHLGDLPVLKVGGDGRATQPVTASRLKLAAIRNRALMIHAGGDNYLDQPSPLGGGGGRVACGVIK